MAICLHSIEEGSETSQKGESASHYLLLLQCFPQQDRLRETGANRL